MMVLLGLKSTPRMAASYSELLMFEAVTNFLCSVSHPASMLQRWHKDRPFLLAVVASPDYRAMQRTLQKGRKFPGNHKLHISPDTMSASVDLLI
jgi:hypothetical protein